MSQHIDYTHHEDTDCIQTRCEWWNDEDAGCIVQSVWTVGYHLDTLIGLLGRPTLVRDDASKSDGERA
ncbi:hypothetical protein LCGC14_2960860 [marine sediment metagenome]|uniref:Uncharacterized protein n=1 Tax=marine sediment metagenome TaxID=412755 RepID=A0A0F8XD42_9ZZZZ